MKSASTFHKINSIINVDVNISITLPQKGINLETLFVVRDVGSI